MGPMIAVVGSAEPERHYDPPVRDHLLARDAAEELGRELASQGCDVVVYSSRDDFIERSIVSGYVASGCGQPGSIHVYGRYGEDDAGFIEVSRYRELFDLHPEPTTDWEVSFYRSLLTVDGILLIGGGRSTFIAGLIALSRRIALAPITAFGGGAERLWQYWTHEPNVATQDDLTSMASDWRTNSAKTLVRSLVEQHRRRAFEHERARREQHRADRRTAFSLLIGIVLLLLTLACIPISYVWKPGTAGSITTLTIAPLLAATCGAIIRNAFDEASNWLRTTVLGTAAGTVAFLLFIAAQLATTPDILNGDGSRRLLFFVIPVGFIAGLTFDAVYSKLRSRDVIHTSTIDGAGK